MGSTPCRLAAAGTGGALDLGGYANFVHRSCDQEGVKIRFALDVSATDWSSEFPVDELTFGKDGQAVDVSDRGLDVETAWIELHIGPMEEGDIALRSLEIGIDGRWSLYGPETPDDFDYMQLFMDDTFGEMGAVRIANAALADWALPAGQIRQLGGATADPIEIVAIEPPEVPAAGTIALITLTVACLGLGAWLLRRRSAPAAA